MSPPSTSPGTSRAARKQQTRRALLDAALRLQEEQSLSSLGLREVTRAAGITPAAFYRHFRDLPDLGVALVEEALGSLHALVRSVLAADGSAERIDRTVELIEQYVRDHPAHIRFVARERHGGVRAVRLAISDQLDRFVREVAGALAADPVSEGWPAEEVAMVAGLFVDQMVLTASAFLAAELGEAGLGAGGRTPAEVARTARSRLLLIHRGRMHWREAD